MLRMCREFLLHSRLHTSAFPAFCDPTFHVRSALSSSWVSLGRGKRHCAVVRAHTHLHSQTQEWIHLADYLEFGILKSLKLWLDPLDHDAKTFKARVIPRGIAPLVSCSWTGAREGKGGKGRDGDRQRKSGGKLGCNHVSDAHVALPSPLTLTFICIFVRVCMATRMCGHVRVHVRADVLVLAGMRLWGVGLVDVGGCRRALGNGDGRRRRVCRIGNC